MSERRSVTTLCSSKFPVSVWKWSLQVRYNNSFAEWKTLFDTLRYAWIQYAQGGAFWTAKSLGDVAADMQKRRAMNGILRG